MRIFTSSPTDFENALKEAYAAGWTEQELSRAGYSSKWIAPYQEIFTICLPETQEENYQLFEAQYLNNN